MIVSEPSRKKFIVFDMGGVLISTDFNSCIKTIYNENKEEFGPVSADELLDLMKQQFGQYKVGAITEDEFWGAFFDKYFNAGKFTMYGNSLTLEYLKEQFRKDFIIPFYNGLALVEEIRDAQKKQLTNLSIGIMSNHSKEWFPYCTQRWKLDTIFTEKKLLVNSSDDDVQCGKPKLKIMQQLMVRIEQAGYKDVQPSDIAFIDDKQANVDAAIEFGMRGICWHGKKTHLDFLVNELKQLGFLEWKK